MALSGLGFREAKALTEGLEKNRRPLEEKRGVLKLPDKLGPLLPAHKKYLRGRDYNVKELERLWGVQGLGIANPYSWRVFIPIVLHGETVSWTTRSISDNVATRYVSAPSDWEAMNHKKLLYGEDYVRHAVIVHEGPLDVWRTGPGAVATCGIGFSRAQITRLSKFLIRVVCFDNEPAAQKRAKQMCDLLENFRGETYNVVLGAKDASASTEEEIEELRSTFLV